MTFDQFTLFTESTLPVISEIVDKYINAVDVEYKSDNSPVTLADREIERHIVGRIRESFPGHAIIGEESGTHAGSAEDGNYEWIIDPIDGTKSFIHGIPLFTTLIGVEKDGKALYGAIYNPLLRELVTGDCHGAYLNGGKVSMRPCADLSQATLLTTDALAFGKYRSMEGFMTLAERCRMMRTWGDAYGYVMLATGRGDIMIDAKMSRWDIAALIPVIRGAGGVITGCDGGEPETADSMVASNPAIHRQVIQILNGE